MTKLPSLPDVLMCECEKLVFPAGSTTVEMYFPRTHCCDMDGAIKVAEMVRPKVREIIEVRIIY
jgi:hypothetical protein